MSDTEYQKKKVTPKQAVAILKEHGTIITEEEAVLVIDFLYFLGELTVKQYIKENSEA